MEFSLFAFLTLWAVSAEPAALLTPQSATSEIRPELSELLELGNRGNWEEVVERGTDLLKTNQHSPELYLLLVAGLQDMGRYSDCEKEARTFLDKFPDSKNIDQILYLLATCLKQTGKSDESLLFLNKAEQKTGDESLKKTIQTARQGLLAKKKVGISLSGALPRDKQEASFAQRIELRILVLALENFKKFEGEYPDRLEDMLAGEDPILKKLPADPMNPGTTFVYERQGDSYSLPALTSSE